MAQKRLEFGSAELPTETTDATVLSAGERIRVIVADGIPPNEIDVKIQQLIVFLRDGQQVTRITREP